MATSGGRKQLSQEQQARSTLHARRYWMPDSQCKACTQCGLPFTFFRRKHHW